MFISLRFRTATNTKYEENDVAINLQIYENQYGGGNTNIYSYSIK